MCCYVKALLRDHDDVSSWVNEGDALIHLGCTEQAIHCFDEALKLNPHDARACTNKGLGLSTLGRMQDAVECYNEALNLDSCDALIWADKADALNELGLFEEAVQCCDSALEVDPRYALAWSNKGDSLRALKRHSEALACYVHSVTYDPGLTDAWRGRALVEDALGKHEEAALSREVFQSRNAAEHENERKLTVEDVRLLLRGIYRSENNTSSTGSIPRTLIYKAIDGREEQVIYATPERAAFHSRIERALSESKTWGEFRRAMPPKEYSRIIHEAFDENDMPRPRGSDLFSSDQVPGTEDSSYPGSMMDEMSSGILPEDLLDVYGVENYPSGFSSCNPFYYVDRENVEELNAELRRRGYEVLDGSEFSIQG